MQYVIYPLVSGREGKKRGEFPVGSVSFEDGSISLECPDYAINRRLEGLFCSSLRVRRPLGSPEGVLTYGWTELEPGSEEHFYEAAARLHLLGFEAEEAK
ncbi:hypothetical protein IJT93_09780 [bacterium]|nr:hypothetical protein [bacterium]